MANMVGEIDAAQAMERANITKLAVTIATPIVADHAASAPPAA